MVVKYFYIYKYLKDVKEFIIFLNKTVLKFLQKMLSKKNGFLRLKMSNFWALSKPHTTCLKNLQTNSTE